MSRAERESCEHCAQTGHMVSAWWGSALVFVVYLPVILAYGFWNLDQLGIERWTASQIGDYLQMVREAARE